MYDLCWAPRKPIIISSTVCWDFQQGKGQRCQSDTVRVKSGALPHDARHMGSIWPHLAHREVFILHWMVFTKAILVFMFKLILQEKAHVWNILQSFPSCMSIASFQHKYCIITHSPLFFFFTTLKSKIHIYTYMYIITDKKFSLWQCKRS